LLQNNNTHYIFFKENNQYCFMKTLSGLQNSASSCQHLACYLHKISDAFQKKDMSNENTDTLGCRTGSVTFGSDISDERRSPGYDDIISGNKDTRCHARGDRDQNAHELLRVNGESA
jgi:hypothetical protein